MSGPRMTLEKSRDNERPCKRHNVHACMWVHCLEASSSPVTTWPLALRRVTDGRTRGPYLHASWLRVHLIKVRSMPHYTKAVSSSRQFGLDVCHLSRLSQWSGSITATISVLMDIRSKRTLYHLGNPVGCTLRKKSIKVEARCI